jgi:hypothetical protein
VWYPAAAVGAVTAGAVVSATTVNGVAEDVSAQRLVAVTSWLPAGAVADELKVYAPAYGELESVPPPVQPVPSPLAKVRWSIPDSVSLEVPVTVKPPAVPSRMYTVVPVALALVNEPKVSPGTEGAVGSLTVMLGDAARFVSVPLELDFSWACQVCAPAGTGAMAPGPPEPVSPYVMVNVLPPESVSEETVIV